MHTKRKKTGSFFSCYPHFKLGNSADDIFLHLTFLLILVNQLHHVLSIRVTAYMLRFIKQSKPKECPAEQRAAVESRHPGNVATGKSTSGSEAAFTHHCSTGAPHNNQTFSSSFFLNTESYVHIL